MLSLRIVVILFFLTFVELASVSAAAANTTIDHDDPSVLYSGHWEQVLDQDANGSSCTHRLSSHDPSASAVVTFRGSAVYFMAPKWPYRVAATISIDDGNPIQIDLQDHTADTEELGPTIPASVVAHQRGLDPNVEHTVRIFTQPGEPFIIFHSLLYTSAEDPPTKEPTPSSSEITGPTSEPQQPSSMSSQMAMTMGVGIGVGTSILLAILFLFVRRRRRNSSGPTLLPVYSAATLPSPPYSPKAFSLSRPLSSSWSSIYVQQPPPSRTATPRSGSLSVRAEALPPTFVTVTCPVWDGYNPASELSSASTDPESDQRKLRLDIPPSYRTRFSSGPEGMTSPIISPAPRYSTLPFTVDRPHSTAKVILAYNRPTSTSDL